MVMSHNRAKGRKSNKPSFNVRKNLVNSKIQSTFSVPTRKKSEKHAESLLESGHYDGITSFNPHGQRITLEDAVVSLYLISDYRVSKKQGCKTTNGRFLDTLYQM